MKTFLSWPRILTCLVIGSAISLTAFLPATEDHDKIHYLYVATPGQTSDLIAAMRSLGRTDVHISNGESGVYLTHLEGWLLTLIVGTLGGAIFWSLTSYLHECFQNLLKEKLK